MPRTAALHCDVAVIATVAGVQTGETEEMVDDSGANWPTLPPLPQAVAVIEIKNTTKADRS